MNGKLYTKIYPVNLKSRDHPLNPYKTLLNSRDYFLSSSATRYFLMTTSLDLVTTVIKSVQKIINYQGKDFWKKFIKPLNATKFLFKNVD